MTGTQKWVLGAAVILAGFVVVTAGQAILDGDDVPTLRQILTEGARS